MIHITDSAKTHLVDIMTVNNKKVKLAVKGGGCSGFTYDWQLVDKKLSDDERFEDLKFNYAIFNIFR